LGHRSRKIPQAVVGSARGRGVIASLSLRHEHTFA
jgi:hypothetical protein